MRSWVREIRIGSVPVTVSGPVAVEGAIEPRFETRIERWPAVEASTHVWPHERGVELLLRWPFYLCLRLTGHQQALWVGRVRRGMPGHTIHAVFNHLPREKGSALDNLPGV